MLRHHSIVGIWSADAIYGPGAQADTVLVFLPDGSGVLEEWNFSLSYYDLFTWGITDGGRLNITGLKSVAEDDAGQVVEKTSLFGVEQWLFSIAEENTPRGEFAEVLTIVRASAKRLPRTEKYGRFVEGTFSQDGSDYQLPTF